MIDSFTIFSKSGTVLYHNPTNGTDFETTAEAINQFICNILLEDSPRLEDRKCLIRPAVPKNSLTQHHNSMSTVCEWNSSKDDKWIGVALYGEVLHKHKNMSWVKRLLKTALLEYSLFYSSQMDGESEEEGGMSNLPPGDSTLFDATFAALLKRAEILARRQSAPSPNNAQPALDSPVQDETENEASSDVQSAIARLKSRNQRVGIKKSSSATNLPEKKKSIKKKTVWHDGTGKITKSALARLDRSGGDGPPVITDDSLAVREAKAAYLPSADDEAIPSWLDDDRDLVDATDDAAPDSWGSSLTGLMNRMSGNKVITEADLEIPLKEMQQLLASKNVAADIAREICDTVKLQLVNQKLQSFTRIKTAVRLALEKAIKKILSPHRDIDLLREVVAKREAGAGFFGGGKSGNRPYVIVMVGINGVGKSTTLAKMAYYLKNNGCTPLLAACDTFRSGAVEQLAVHAKCLDVPLYHRGYAKDSSAVATDAISQAVQDGNDVVLVDTAGRMQNNVPLMKALAKLCRENRPDLVCFVGEALVGNDGVSQLKMFDAALGNGRIDGIVLTKFDTVSDKVGAALTMTRVTGAKILFVGVGQKYNHLKKLSVKSVIKSLFS